MKIALVSCSAKKQGYPCMASEMYSPSVQFALSFEYAKLVADRVYILSAKHRLLSENTYLEPYNLALSDLTTTQRIIWGQIVMTQLQEECNIEKDEFIILAGRAYYEHLEPSLIQSSIPLRHVPLFSRVKALRELIDQVKNEGSNINVCDELHRLFNGMPRYSASEIAKIPFDNGIYIVFEVNEMHKNWQRIVRVGTHTSEDRLRQRLKDHFIQENKDGSIFRKNIGKALLTQQNHPYLKTWTLDTSKQENRVNVDSDVQQAVEREVSSHLRGRMSFTAFPATNLQDRLRLEEAIISSLHHDPGFGPSINWLGNMSPEEEIRKSGLWLKRGFNADPLTLEGLVMIRKLDPGPESTSSLLSKRKIMQSKNPNVNVASQKIYLQKGVKMPGTAEIRRYILDTFEQYRARGEDTCTLVSGEIHAAMGLQNTMPSVCNVMYKLKGSGDQVLHSTPSGKSSTIRIKYYLE